MSLLTHLACATFSVTLRLSPKIAAPVSVMPATILGGVTRMDRSRVAILNVPGEYHSNLQECFVPVLKRLNLCSHLPETIIPASTRMAMPQDNALDARTTLLQQAGKQAAPVMLPSAVPCPMHSDRPHHANVCVHHNLLQYTCCNNADKTLASASQPILHGPVTAGANAIAGEPMKPKQICALHAWLTALSPPYVAFAVTLQLVQVYSDLVCLSANRWVKKLLQLPYLRDLMRAFPCFTLQNSYPVVRTNPFVSNTCAACPTYSTSTGSQNSCEFDGTTAVA